nr:Gag-Pol polyprotein [Tanacetum cinerariifolium]
AQAENDEFINIFCTPVQERKETSFRHVNSSNMHTFYQHHPSEHRWTKDHPLEQVIGNPSQSVRTRRQLESDGEMCIFALTVSRTEPKNIKEAMANSSWIESMQEELYQFNRLDVWELVDRPLCKNVINMKWLWKNKRDEENTVIQNKSRLMAKGYAQNEGIDFEESFAPRTTLEHDSLSHGPQCQENVTQADRTVTMSNELDLLFSLMFAELINGSSQVVSKSSVVTTVDAPNQRQQHTTLLNNQTTPDPTCQVPTHASTVASNENMNQAEIVEENAQAENDEFINIFCTPVQERKETSFRHGNSSNMHTFYQHHPFEHRWTKDHPLEQVIRNPSQSVRTRRQLESDGEMCMFALTVSRTELKNIKEAMANSS